MPHNNDINITDASLLKRLNALKQTNITLETKPYTGDFAGALPDVSPAPGRALFDTFSDRFRSLNGQRDARLDVINSIDKGQRSDLVGDEDGKTVEDLLSELGPEDQWLVPKDEDDQIAELLRSANDALKVAHHEDSFKLAKPGHDDSEQSVPSDTHRALLESHALTNKDDAELEEDASTILAETMDEIEQERQFMAAPSTAIKNTGVPSITSQSSSRLPPPQQLIDAQSTTDDPPTYNDIQDEDDLSARFAALNMPTAPSMIKTPPPRQTQPPQPKPTSVVHTDEDIESWCIICQDDATLSCLGCDDDLYCTNCWLEGHKGPDAGFEERTHKAVQYSKKKGKQKERQKQSFRRTMIGA